MAHKYADQAMEVTATAGTVAYVLAGAVAGKFSFASFMSDGDTTTCACVGACSDGSAGVEWGVYTYSGGSLFRTSVLGGSNGTSPVNWLAGVNKVIYCTALAERSLLLDSAGTGMVGLPTSLTLTGLTGTLTVPGGLTVQGDVALSPSNANVVISPTGTGIVTIAPATAGSMNNIAIGGSTPAAGAFTALSCTGNATFGDASTDSHVLTGAVHLGGPTGNETLIISAGASYVNCFRMEGRIAGAGPILWTQGADTNINGELRTKGAGSWLFHTASNDLQMAVTPTASANRRLTLTGSNGSDPTIGTSAGRLRLAPGGIIGAMISSPASAVNYIELRSGIAGATGAPYIIVDGTDTNIALNMYTKGTGALRLYTDGYGAAPEQLRIPHTAAANRYPRLTGSNGGASLLDTSAGPLAIAPADQNLALLAGAGSFGGATGGIFIANANTPPSTNPSGGGVLYVDSGALKWRGSGGTVTTIAAA